MTEISNEVVRFVSYAPEQRCEGYNRSATGPKINQQLTNKTKAAKRMAEVWQQPLEEDGDMAMAMATYQRG